MAFSNPSTSLTVPAGATSGTPRIVLGPDIPVELQTYYGLGVFKMVAVLLWYSNVSNSYFYRGVLQNTNTIVEGFATPGFTPPVVETARWDRSGAGVQVSMGVGSEASGGVVDYVFGDTGGVGGGSGTFLVQSDGGFAIAAAPFKVDTIEQPRGVVKWVGNTAPGVAAAAETSFANAAVTLKAGYAYKVTVFGSCSNSLANTGVHVRFRLTGAGGTDIGELTRVATPSAGAVYAMPGTAIYWRNATGADITRTVHMCVAPFGGGNAAPWGSVSSPWGFEIECRGAASAFPQALQMP